MPSSLSNPTDIRRSFGNASPQCLRHRRDAQALSASGSAARGLRCLHEEPRPRGRRRRNDRRDRLAQPGQATAVAALQRPSSDSVAEQATPCSMRPLALTPSRCPSRRHRSACLCACFGPVTTGTPERLVRRSGRSRPPESASFRRERGRRRCLCLSVSWRWDCLSPSSPS
jgi:hypothetical protein